LYAAEIARQFQPEKIILFGSYAHGQPTPDSDVDLLVVRPHDRRNVEKASEIRAKVDAPPRGGGNVVRERRATYRAKRKIVRRNR
jgi:predicted nucleotidyltransferase